METAILQDLGLTNAEIKIYIALLELGVATAGPIIDRTRLQNSVVHMTLHKLGDKGFVTFVKKGKIKHYHATDPQNILKFIEDKKTRFKEILPVLLAKQDKREEPEAEVFEGFKGFKNLLREGLEEAKSGDEFLFFSFYTKPIDKYPEVYNFLKEYEGERFEKGIKIKGLAPSDLKPMLATRFKSDIKYVDFPVPINISIINDRVMFFPWQYEPVSFLIKSKALAESLSKYFNLVWKEKN